MGEEGGRLTRFVIFGSGRAGSSLLVDLLDSSPDVFCEYGLFLDGDPDPHRWLASRLSMARQLRASAYGIRLLVPHLVDDAKIPDVRAFLKSLADDGWQIMSLGRLNPVRTVVSYVHAARHGFHLRAGDGPWRYEPMTVSREELAHWIAVVSGWMSVEAAALRGIAAVKLSYESDLADEAAQQATLRRVFSTLGVPAAATHTALRRQMPDGPISALFANYDEVRDLLDQFSAEHPAAPADEKHQS